MIIQNDDKSLVARPSFFLLLQAAVYGVCGGWTYFVLQQQQQQQKQQEQRTPRQLVSLNSVVSKNYSPLDWISMACALFQPRVFLGMILWQNFRQGNNVAEKEDSNGKPRLPTETIRNAVTSTTQTASTNHATNKHATHVTPDVRKDRLKKKKKRYLELMVHNVSHTDLILGLEPVTAPSQAVSPSNNAPVESYILCRPRFSRFRKLCSSIYQQLLPSSLLLLPCYQRRYDTPLYSIVLGNTNDSTEYHHLPPTPTGLYLHKPVLLTDINEVRVRGRDQDKMQSTMQIRQVFFPLLASLLSRWNQQIALKHSYFNPKDMTPSMSHSNNNVHRVLLLVSGVGTPRDATLDPADNSTQTCVQLMEHFVQLVDPEITIVKIHSDWNVFRYDENVRFVKEVFMPKIHAYRDAHAKGLPYPHESMSSAAATLEAVPHDAPFHEDWRDSFTTTLSWADGSNARTYAIQCGMRDYRPIYFHFWQLKTFWHECKIVIDDVEVHSYAAMELIPPVDTTLSTLSVQDDNGDIARVVEEVKAFRHEVQDMFFNDTHEMSRFWLRQTRKPVLAVLLVRTEQNSEPILYRGTNMEVSMPTGSLCAERNVIGSALADNPSLKRRDLKVIAVLAVPLDEPTMQRQLTFPRTFSNTSIDQFSRKSSIGSETDGQNEWQWTNPVPGSASGSEVMVDMPFTMGPQDTSITKEDEEDDPPARRIDLVSSSTTRTVFIKQSVKLKDRNPLAPCGACNEWLKKIAESNPYFKILTFTDCQCQGVYITPCKDS